MAILKLAETDEAIVAVKRNITEQMEGADRRSIIACLERDLAVHQTRRTELASIVAGIEEAWEEISCGRDWYDMFRECVRDLDNLLLER